MYSESVVINTSDLTIEGSPGAVVAAAGAIEAIGVGTGRITVGPGGFPVCPPLALRNVTVVGLTVRNVAGSGIRLQGVDGYSLSGGNYVSNRLYGSSRSARGTG
ncbi:MAG: hypothetical protein LC733_01665 [Actinobacteria bacterium]|nr:hypothetical protein [Actinomycetota bacterium]